MGWGANAAHKRSILGDDGVRKLISASSGIKTPNTVVVDVNAVLRNKFGYNCVDKTNEITPMSVMRQFFLGIMKTYPRTSLFVFCFDSSHLVPEQRGAFYREKRYKADTREPREGEIRAADDRIYKRQDAPLDSSQIDKITPGHVPPGSSGSVVWSKIWNSSAAKSRLWDVLAMCLEDLCETHQETHKENPNTIAGLLGMTLPAATTQTHFIIDAPNANRHYYPNHLISIDTNLWTNWGEADTKCFQWGALLANHPIYGPAIFDTIDWDSFIQVVAHAVPNLSVKVGTIYTLTDELGFENEFYSMTSCKKAAGKGMTPERRHEIIQCSAMPDSYGSRANRIHFMFWSLCCGGVDYCNGLSTFGFGEPFILSIIESKDYMHHDFLMEDWDSKNPLVRKIRFSPLVFIQTLFKCHSKFLNGKRKRKAHNTSLKDFADEIHHVLFCVFYYLGWDALRPRGGPIITNEETNPLFPCSTMDDLHTLSSSDMVFTEEYPITLDMVKNNTKAIEFLFNEEQLRMVIGGLK